VAPRSPSPCADPGLILGGDRLLLAVGWDFCAAAPGQGWATATVVLNHPENGQPPHRERNPRQAERPQRWVSPSAHDIDKATTTRSAVDREPSDTLNPRSCSLGSTIRLLAALLAVFGVGLLAPAGADAHAFLISSSPAQGARLGTAPSLLTLAFSEPVVAGSERVSVTRAGAGVIKTAPPVLRGALVHQSFPGGLHGVFVVSWQVLADDGHLTAGEFAFAVGSGTALPSVATGTASRTPPEQTLFSWLVFLGLALALGGLVSELVVFGPRVPGSRRAPLSLGFALTLLGALGEFVLVAGQRAGAGFTAGLDLGHLRDVARTRPGVLTLVLIGSLILAAGLVRFSRLRWLGVASLLAAALSISLRGHAGTSGHAWAVGADALHLIGVALWVGMLAHLVLVISSGRDDPGGSAVAHAVRRYSALALPTVLVLLVAGAVDALAELRSVFDLVNTGYGRTLLVKGAVVLIASSLALGSRLAALPANPGVRFGVLRRLTRSELAVLLGVLVAAAVLANAPPPRSFAQTPRATVALGPPPLAGPSLQLAGLTGLGVTIGVTAAPDELRFTVLRVEDPAPSGTRLTVQAIGTGRPADLFPRPCGPGCFDIHYRLRRGVTRLRANVTIPNWMGGSVEFSVPWPPQPAQPTLLAKVISAMRAVPRLVMIEHDSSGPHANAPPTTFRGDGQSFIAGEPWSSGALDVRPLDPRPPYRRLAFALPGSDIWVRVSIDDRDRLRSETMVTPGHLLQRTFTYP